VLNAPVDFSLCAAVNVAVVASEQGTHQSAPGLSGFMASPSTADS